MNIDKLISEEIHRYLQENVFDENMYGENSFFEKKKKKKKKKKKEEPKKSLKDVKKKGKKLKNGRRGDFDAKADRETNPNINKQDAADISDIIDSDIVNTSAVAQKVYPHHTPEGAQSQLRKKIKGLTNDNGSKYRLKKKEADMLNKIIAQEI